ncbi:MAG: CBS domain-containing protein [Streptosporangiales bacterium]|nr:CBS domain-containing protein [Streptosporangiales bacterium]
MKRTLVEMVMTPRPVIVSPDTPFKEIVDVLLRNRISGVPVVDRSGRVMGVVSDADLALKEAELEAGSEVHVFDTPKRRRERRKSRGTRAAELMSTPAVSVSPRRTVDEAAALMRTRRIRRLPVTEPMTGRLVGMVSRTDLLRQYLRADEEITAEIEGEVLRRTLATDPRRFGVQVHDGVVRIRGQVERRSLVGGVIKALEQVEGVIAVDAQLSYEVDDRLVPTPPTYW